MTPRAGRTSAPAPGGRPAAGRPATTRPPPRPPLRPPGPPGRGARARASLSASRPAADADHGSPAGSRATSSASSPSTPPVAPRPPVARSSASGSVTWPSSATSSWSPRRATASRPVARSSSARRMAASRTPRADHPPARSPWPTDNARTARRARASSPNARAYSTSSTRRAIPHTPVDVPPGSTTAATTWRWRSASARSPRRQAWAAATSDSSGVDATTAGTPPTVVATGRSAVEHRSDPTFEHQAGPRGPSPPRPRACSSASYGHVVREVPQRGEAVEAHVKVRVPQA